MSKRDYYEVLGVNRSATDQDLKSAYRRLAHQHHPDKNPADPHAEERFKEAAEAYAALSDPEQRSRYDRFGHAGVSTSAGAAWGAPGFGGIEDILGDLFGFGDVFGAGARGGSRRSAQQRGADLRYDLEISLEQAAEGMTAQLRIPKLESCETCDGSGAAPGTKPETCRTCAGGAGRGNQSADARCRAVSESSRGNANGNSVSSSRTGHAGARWPRPRRFVRRRIGNNSDDADARAAQAP